MEVFASLHAWDEQYQFHVCGSRCLRFQPVSSRQPTCAKKTWCLPPFFTTKQFPTPTHMQVAGRPNVFTENAPASNLSVPVGPIERQNSTSTSTKIYCVDPHQRISCPIQRWIALISPNVPKGRFQRIKSPVGLMFKPTNHLQSPASAKL